MERKMEKQAKQVAGSSSSSSSSSFTVDLFGPKESSKSSSSSTCVFGSIFGPPNSLVPGRDSSTKDYIYGHAYSNAKHQTTTDNYKTQKGKKGKNSNNENGRSVEACYYNSSIYYGAQQLYSPTTHNITPPHDIFKNEDGGSVGANESNSSSASRGNWWQGSLYY